MRNPSHRHDHLSQRLPENLFLILGQSVIVTAIAIATVTGNVDMTISMRGNQTIDPQMCGILEILGILEIRGIRETHETHGTCAIFESHAIEISETREIYEIREIEEMHGPLDVQILGLMAAQNVALSPDRNPKESKRRL